MKLAQFKSEKSGAQRLGILLGESVVDVAELASSASHNMPGWLAGVNAVQDVISRADEALAEISGLVAQTGGAEGASAFSLESVTFLPPVYPGKIVAIGRNYVDHAIEGGDAPPAAPLIFTKLPNSLSAHNAPIVLPVISTQVDYEA